MITIFFIYNFNYSINSLGGGGIFFKASQLLFNNKELSGENSLRLRNIQSCRNYLTEFICILAISRKNKIITKPKIKGQDFNVGIFKSKLTAQDTLLVNNILKTGDPSEIGIVVNEFANYITQANRNRDKALYWINWMIEWDKLNRKRFRIL